MLKSIWETRKRIATVKESAMSTIAFANRMESFVIQCASVLPVAAIIRQI